MSELALKSTTCTTFIEVGPGQQIAAVRAEGGEVEILGRNQASNATQRLLIRPTSHDLGWMTPCRDVTWTEFRAVGVNAECIVHIAPLGNLVARIRTGWCWQLDGVGGPFRPVSGFPLCRSGTTPIAVITSPCSDTTW
jgi:hypothetical protein